MEVTVLEVRNPPARPVLSLRMGPAQQQAHLEVNRPIMLPHPGPQHAPVEVGLFQQLASEVLPDSDGAEAVCSIPIRHLDGSATQVKLRVRRASKSPGVSPASSPASSALHRSVSRKRTGPKEDERDRLLQWIHGLVQDVLREQPVDPCRFMLQQLRKGQETTPKTQRADLTPSPSSTTDGRHDSKSPRPPDRPCPGRTGRLHPRQPARQAPQTGSSSTTGSWSGALAAQGQQQQQLQAPRVPVSPAHAEARYSLGLIFRSPACVAAAEESLREKVQKEAAQALTGLTLRAACERLVAKMEHGAREAKANRRASCPISSRPPSSQRGGGRRDSLPTPYVALGTESSSWGQWLCSSSSGG